LIRAAEDAGVKIRTGDAVVSVKKLTGNTAEGEQGDTAPRFEIELKSGEILSAIAFFSLQAAIRRVLSGQKS
jgi:hypothetical protein